MNIVFWGEDSFSNVVLNSLIEAGHQVRLVVTPLYENVVYRRLANTCDKYQIEFLRIKNINSKEVEDKLSHIPFDIGVVAHFEKLIKPNLLAIPKYGFINLHPSMLPDYRGMSPQHWPIINGDHVAGITVHKIDDGIDTGDIIVQRSFSLREDMYVSDLQKIWLEHYKTIMVEAIDNILNHRPVIKQSHLPGRYYGKLKPEQCVIDINRGTKEVYNLIRGVSLPYQGASLGNHYIFTASIGDPEVYNKISTAYPDNGFYMATPYGNIIKMKDGFLIIKKFITK